MTGFRELCLAATLLMLAAGPLLVTVARNRPRLGRLVDMFVLAGIAALVAIEVLPETLKEGGALSLLFMLAGLFGPTLIERGIHSARRLAHLGTLGLALVGLILHTLADGTVLSAATGVALPIAVALHTLPVGMAVWWLLAPHFGRAAPTAILILMAAGTVVGFHYGISLSEALGAQPWAWFQALIAGSILHVIFGRPHMAHENGVRPPGV